MKNLILVITTTFIFGCSAVTDSTGKSGDIMEKVSSGADTAKLAMVLDAQSDELKARYQYRHPQETLEFFGIEPGMTVMEALPGGGWYTKILLPYLGENGQLVGVDYAQDMFPKFGFFDDEFIEKKKTWRQDWLADAEKWRDENSATLDAFVFGSMPDSMEGTADAALFIRALHNLNRFENDGEYLTTALDNVVRMLKPGGIVGVVQHRAPDSASDESSQGGRGYLRRDDVIAMMKAAGLVYVGGSDINANPKDQPSDEEVVWRLPPTLFTSREDEELRAKMNAIGETNRMTLKFRKP